MYFTTTTYMLAKYEGWSYKTWCRAICTWSKGSRQNDRNVTQTGLRTFQRKVPTKDRNWAIRNRRIDIAICKVRVFMLIFKSELQEATNCSKLAHMTGRNDDTTCENQTTEPNQMYFIRHFRRLE